MNRNEALMQLIEEAHRGEFDFPTSARLALKIRETIDDPDCHLDEAVKLIQAEPLLAARVISLANSVLYNPAGRAITDVKTAASRVGFQALRTLAMAYVTRQMAGTSKNPEHQRLASQLWEHSAHVAALARIVAGKITKKTPDAALFAGLVHEIGGFYLLSRVEKYPALLAPETDPNDIGLVSVVNTLSLAVLRNLGVPDPVVDTVEQYVEGYLALPPASLGDTLILADHAAKVLSPFVPSEGTPAEDGIEQAMLDEMLKESADEVTSLTRALCA